MLIHWQVPLFARQTGFILIRDGLSLPLFIRATGGPASPPVFLIFILVKSGGGMAGFLLKKYLDSFGGGFGQTVWELFDRRLENKTLPKPSACLSRLIFCRPPPKNKTARFHREAGGRTSQKDGHSVPSVLRLRGRVCQNVAFDEHRRTLLRRIHLTPPATSFHGPPRTLTAADHADSRIGALCLAPALSAAPAREGGTKGHTPTLLSETLYAYPPGHFDPVRSVRSITRPERQSRRKFASFFSAAQWGDNLHSPCLQQASGQLESPSECPCIVRGNK